MSVNYVFGIHAVESVLRNAPESVKRAFISNNKNQRHATLVNLLKQHSILITELSLEKLDRMVVDNHQGVILDVKENTKKNIDLNDLLQNTQKAVVLVVDHITDPHNLGAILRSADAFGVTAVIIPKDGACGITPVVKKVACGAAETLPIYVVTNLARTLKELKDLGVWIVGTALESGAQLPEKIDFNMPVALVLGSEGKGMRRLIQEECDFLVQIPMQGTVQSINVSAATAIMLYEIQRQRRKPTLRS